MGTQLTKLIIFLRKVRQSKLKLLKSLSRLTLITQQRLIILRSKIELSKNYRIKFKDGKARFRELANTAKPLYLVKNEWILLRSTSSNTQKYLSKTFNNFYSAINLEVLILSKIRFAVTGVRYILGLQWSQLIIKTIIIFFINIFNSN